MKLINSRQSFSLVGFTTAILATSIFASASPASAALIKIGFCGFFGGDESGNSGKVDGNLTVDEDLLEDASKNFGFVDAKITTTTDGRKQGNTSALTYTGLNLVAVGQGTEALGNIFEAPSKYWQFNSLGNIFLAVVPVSFFSNPAIPVATANFELRPLPLTPPLWRKDPDITRTVPEPITILGSATALGIGGFLKRKSSKTQKTVKQSA